MLPERGPDEAARHARAAVAGLAPTPLLRCAALDRALGGPAWLKLEGLQPTGSFKVRGALAALTRIAGGEVVTASAGNHGRAVAWAARERGVRVRVFVPAGTAPDRVEALRALGAAVEVGPEGFDATEALARRLARERGARFLSAYDAPDVLAGNGGTLAAEIREQLPEVARVVVPVGGGGLAGGLARALPAHVELVAVQHARCRSLERSLRAGRAATTMPPFPTRAVGLEGGLGRLGFAALAARRPRLVHVEEAAIARAFRWALDEARVLVEPTAAAALAAALQGEAGGPGPTVVVLTGRNASPDDLRAWACA